MNSKKRPCSIERVNHEIIEQQVLLELSNKDKIALVLSETLLDVVIDAIEWRVNSLPTGTKPRSSDLLRDLKQLKHAAFGAER